MNAEPFYLGRPLAIAHRGASTTAPENTLAAFQAAMDQSADGIELDVTRCATGEVVVMHDSTVDRTTNGSGRVLDLSLAQLRELDAGSWFAPTFAGQRVPLLSEVLELVGHHTRLNIEIKGEGSGNGLEETVAALVAQHGLGERVIISSFREAALRRMRHAAPALPRAFLYSTPIPLSLLLSSTHAMLGLGAVHPNYRLVHEPYIERAHAAGLRVNVWTVDEAGAMARLAALGVDAIITNRPAQLLAVLAAKRP